MTDFSLQREPDDERPVGGHAQVPASPSWTPPAQVGQPAPYGQGPFGPAYRPPMVTISQKTPGIAVLLSFLWLGAGNLYVNQVGVGVTLLIVNVFLVMLSLTFFGLFLAAPVWFILFVVSAITATNGAREHNARYGVL